MELKELVKPPFANYDVVVYFGCGLFCLPLIYHYIIEPFGLRFPRFQFHLGMAFADAAVSTLSLLFTVYILGHMLAYAASYFIEKTVDTAFGKISSAIVIGNLASAAEYHETLQGWIGRRVKAAMTGRNLQSTILRFLVLVPVTPSLLLAFATRSFDYFRTRIPPRVFTQVRRETRRRGYGPVGLHTKWYKAVEHDVINNCPGAVGRMYNYLVIGGIFRSLSFIFLMCCWAELISWIVRRISGHELVKTIMSDHQLPYAHAFYIAAFNILFVFSLTAYIKFSRRYAEEAIFAFVLTRSNSSTVSTSGD